MLPVAAYPLAVLLRGEPLRERVADCEGREEEGEEGGDDAVLSSCDASRVLVAPAARERLLALDSTPTPPVSEG